MNFGQYAVPEAIVTLASIALTAVATYWKGNIDRATRAAIRFETELRDIVERKFGLPSPDTAAIHRDVIESSLQEATDYDGSDDPIRTVYSDGTYLAPVDAVETNILKTFASLPQFLPYRPERFDCENYAQLFRVLAAFIGGSNAVGVVYDWSGGHAYNVIVRSDGELVFYEPQDDTEVEIGEADYQLGNALIVF